MIRGPPIPSDKCRTSRLELILQLNDAGGKEADAMSNLNDELKSIAQKRTVRYEVWPHWEIHEDARVMVGFNLELLGTYEHGQSPLGPGAQSGGQTYEDLKRIAFGILPKEVRPSYYEIEPFDQRVFTELCKRLL